MLVPHTPVCPYYVTAHKTIPCAQLACEHSHTFLLFYPHNHPKVMFSPHFTLDSLRGYLFRVPIVSGAMWAELSPRPTNPELQCQHWDVRTCFNNFLFGTFIVFLWLCIFNGQLGNSV